MKKNLIFIILILIPIAVFSNVEKDDKVVVLKQQTQLQEVIDKALKSFVFVDASGSGVIISSDGYIITNDHVAGADATWRVRTHDGVLRFADLVGTDPFGDIALLKIRDGKDLPHIELGDSDKATVGEGVIAIGNPFAMGNLDEKPTVTVGLISAIHRFHYNYTNAMMTDAPLNPGNSGGPLITLDGKLIGINGLIDNRFQIRVSSGIGYAVSSNQIKRFLPQLKAAKGGFVYHGRITGMNFPSLWGTNRSTVLKVKKGSYAFHNGLRTGDRILKVDGMSTPTPTRFIGLIRSYPMNTLIKLEVERQKETKTIPIKLENYPISMGKAHLEITFYPITTRKKKDKRILKVAKVTPKSAGDIAGVKPGDIITSFAGTRISPVIAARFPDIVERYFLRYAHPYSGGAKVEITVIRNQRERTLVMDIVAGTTYSGLKMASLRKNPSALDLLKEIAGVKDPTKVDSQLKILDVRKGMFADRGGLQRGDIITQINGRKVTTRNAYSLLLKRCQPGQRVLIKVRRGGKIVELRIELGLKRSYDLD